MGGLDYMSKQVWRFLTHLTYLTRFFFFLTKLSDSTHLTGFLFLAKPCDSTRSARYR